MMKIEENEAETLLVTVVLRMTKQDIQDVAEYLKEHDDDVASLITRLIKEELYR